ncbi:MAG: hypothetical protein ABL986_02680 [Vicinamibacterales bacterium]
MTGHRFLLLAFLALVTVPVAAAAQGPGRGAAPPPATPRAASPVDLTGYWVSVVSEDWRWRMVTPIKGDFASVPITPEARRVGELWDPAKDEAAGLQCKAYGAPAIMRRPGRVHITWQDDQTLKLELDEGSQVRLFHFGGSPPSGARPSWQGYSVANWERPVQGIEPPDLAGIFSTRTANRGRSLEVTTRGLRDGYLRANGLPYSADTTVEEFYDYHKLADGAEWLTVTTVVTDPKYLKAPWITSSDFKKEPDGSKFSPGPCSAR